MDHAKTLFVIFRAGTYGRVRDNTEILLIVYIKTRRFKDEWYTSTKFIGI